MDVPDDDGGLASEKREQKCRERPTKENVSSDCITLWFLKYTLLVGAF